MRLNFYFVYHISITVVFCSIFRDEHNSVTNINELKLKQTIQEIAKTWATHDVTIISHDKRQDDKVNRVCNIISTVAAPLYATNYFKTSNLSIFATNDHLAATSRTLIIFVYGAPLAPAMADVTKIKRHLYKASHVKHSPKVLLVLLLNQENIDIQEQLEYLWKRLYPYVIALEIPPTFTTNKTMSFYVHGYRKYAPSYNRIPYNGDVSDWYIDQFQNISGAEFKLCPYKWSSILDDPLKVELNVLEEKLNVSLNVSLPTTKVSGCGMTYNIFYLFYSTFYSSFGDHSAPVYIDKFCLFVPMFTQRDSGLKSWGLILASIVGILIVAIILGFSIITDIESFKHPVHIVSVILGVSLSSLKLSKLCEKILYLCLVHVATRYTSMLYTELFNEVATGTREMKIEDFKDLYGLNLTIHLSKSLYKFFTDAKNANVPVDLFPIFQVINASDDDIITESEDRKVGRFSVQTFETFRQKPQEASMKRTKLCIGSVMIVHLITPKWPFKERVNDILWRINEHGFREYEFSKFSKLSKGDYAAVGLEQGTDASSSAQRRMVMALLYGYVVVVLVFIGEVVVGWILKKTRIKGRNE